MKANQDPACPHCGDERPSHLIPRNYLCPECVRRAADVLGRRVILTNGLTETPRGLSASGLAAHHEDGSPCLEVAKRHTAYIDGVAYRAGEGRFGGTVVWPFDEPAPTADQTEPHPEEMDVFWHAGAAALAEEIRWLKDGDFVMIEYGESTDDAIAPYAQVALDGDGYWCEIVSNDYLPGDTWPLHGDWLKEAGWDAPDADCPNWHSLRTGSQAVAAAVLDGMRNGRACSDVRLLDWRVATMPPEM